MKTAKYFDKNSKKRDLSGDSNPEEERKKIRDGTRIFFNKKPVYEKPRTRYPQITPNLRNFKDYKKTVF